jgi:hypothetical protein
MSRKIHDAMKRHPYSEHKKRNRLDDRMRKKYYLSTAMYGMTHPRSEWQKQTYKEKRGKEILETAGKIGRNNATFCLTTFVYLLDQ